MISSEEIKRYLDSIERLEQTQMSLEDQLKVLRQAANKLGLYDAADFLRMVE